MLDKRNVILIGEGARGVDLTPILAAEVPILSSWQAADIIDNWHPSYFGRPGVFGQRCANRILHRAERITALGCRLALPLIGYQGLRQGQTLEMVDVDPLEARRFPGAIYHPMRVSEYLAKRLLWPADEAWFEQCRLWREEFPWFDHSHKSKSNECINAYEVIHRLEPLLRADEVIITDMGVALAGAFQALKVKPPQRLMTSGGLGEMGCGLPAAIGASLARGVREVLCLHCDGGMMLNLQELATIAHHKLPIKIIVFANNGYAMLKSTQRNMKAPYSGVDRDSGITLPYFVDVGRVFDIPGSWITRLSDLDHALQRLLDDRGPRVLQIDTDPEQEFSPKLQPIRGEDGSVRSPSFEELT